MKIFRKMMKCCEILFFPKQKMNSAQNEPTFGLKSNNHEKEKEDPK